MPNDTKKPMQNDQDAQKQREQNDPSRKQGSSDAENESGKRW